MKLADIVGMARKISVDVNFEIPIHVRRSNRRVSTSLRVDLDSQKRSEE